MEWAEHPRCSDRRGTGFGGCSQSKSVFDAGRTADDGARFLSERADLRSPGRGGLSYTMWQRSFGGDRNVLGKTVHIATQ